MTPYQIYLGDNVNSLQTHVPDCHVDLTVTSPPYDNLRDYKGDTWDFDALLTELHRVTKPGGVVMWNVADQTVKGSETGTSFRQALAFIEAGWTLHDTMIYEKANFSNPSTTRYHQVAEWMFVFSKGKPKTFNPIKDKPNAYYSPEGKPGTMGKNTVRNKDGTMKARKAVKVNTEFGMRGNVWRMKTAGQENMCKSIAHPAKMPAAMARDHILSWSNPGDVILDPFGGSGTTGVEALKLGRKFIGIEVASDYYQIMEKALNDVVALNQIISPAISP